LNKNANKIKYYGEGIMVNITIDGKQFEVKEGTTVLNAAREAGIEIPTLCDHPALTPYGGCRLCVVEVDGMRTLQPSCTLPVSNNMVVRTNTEKTKAARKFVLTLLFSERNHLCAFCVVSGGDCELQNSAYAEGMTHWPIQPTWQQYPVDSSHEFMVIEHNRCILCRRCVRACAELVGNFTLGLKNVVPAAALLQTLARLSARAAAFPAVLAYRFAPPAPSLTAGVPIAAV
jgi:formate dehydrogenase major subunit